MRDISKDKEKGTHSQRQFEGDSKHRGADRENAIVMETITETPTDAFPKILSAFCSIVAEDVEERRGKAIISTLRCD